MNTTLQAARPFVPSTKQAAIFRWAKYDVGSAVVIAVAGSGKSTTMVRLLEHIDPRDPVLMLAFNSAIAKENTAKIAALGLELGRNMQQVRSNTFHGLGFGAVCRRLNKSAREMNVDGGKVRKLAKAAWDEDTFKLYATFCADLVGLAKSEGIGPLTDDLPGNWMALVEHHDLTLESEEANMERAIELARGLLRESNKVSQTGHIDFNDQIYLPLLWKLSLYQNRWVIIDEAQDTNPVRRALAHKALRPASGRFGGRLIAVGDPKQAIYGFTGASSDAIDLIKREFGCTELPLTVSYRCPKAVGRVAQQLVPYFEVADSAPEGEVLDLRLKDALEYLGPQDAVLCRQTRPLVGLAYNLMAQGIGCHVLGSEIGKGLVKLIDQMQARTVDGLVTKLETYRARETEKLLAKEEDVKAAAVEDRVACVMTFVQNLPENQRTLKGLIEQIERLFTDSNGVLTLCTVHKAKGREWNTVAILEPELMPGRARQAWQEEQEMNLVYVAVTRAQERLIYIQTEKERR